MSANSTGRDSEGSLIGPTGQKGRYVSWQWFDSVMVASPWISHAISATSRVK